MKKFLAAVALCFSGAAMAESYTYHAPVQCGAGGAPEYCGVALDNDGDGSTITVNTSWAGGQPSPGQTYPLDLVHLTVWSGLPSYSIDEYDFQWNGGEGVCSTATIENVGQLYYGPFVFNVVCTTARGTLTMQKTMSIITVRGRNFWKILNGAASLQ